MTEYQFSSSAATKQVLDLLSPLATVDTQNPDVDAKFPKIIVNEPLQRPKQIQCKIDLQFSIEVWHNSMWDTSRLFDLVVQELYKLNIRLVNNTTNFRDPLAKAWRKGGTFEVRYNTITNSYEVNR